MISDPKTTPNHPLARIIYAVLIASVSFYLSAFKFINAAPVWVLVFASPVVPVLDWLFKAERFSWGSVMLSPRAVILSPKGEGPPKSGGPQIHRSFALEAQDDKRNHSTFIQS
jgi:hypothetical protein